MTREELARIVWRLKQARDERITIVRIVINPDGSLGEVISRRTVNPGTENGR